MPRIILYSIISLISCGFFTKIAMGGTKPTLTMVYPEVAPHNYLENGAAKGIQPEIVDYVAERLGIRVVHKFYPWARAQNKLESGEVDATVTTPTVNRFQYAAFGKEKVVPCYWNLFIRKGNTELAEKIEKFKGLEDLKAFNLIDFLGNGWTKAFMKEENGYKISYVSKVELLPVVLAHGRTEILITSATWMHWWAEKKGVAELIEEHDIDWPWTRFHFVFMVSRKSPWLEKGLIRAFDYEIRKMKQSGAWLNILKKYKNPHGLGRPFTTMLDEEYERKGGFYVDYDSYPVYTVER